MSKSVKKKEISQQFKNLLMKYRDELIEMLNGSSFAKMIARDDKTMYEQYKKGTLVSEKESDYRNMYILSLIEGLGFPMDELGTYLYKELVMEVKDQLEKIEEKDSEAYNELYNSLNDVDSNIYLWVASDYLEMGKDSYLIYLSQAVKKIDKSKIKKSVCEKLFNEEEQQDFAFQTIQLGKEALNYKYDQKEESNKKLNYLK